MSSVLPVLRPGVPPPRVLSIAGTDPSGGAGLQADLKSIAAHGGYGMGVVTALVAQNTRGVRAVHLPPISFLAQQLDSVSDDVSIDAVKIGMLGTAPVIETVSEWVSRTAPQIVVLDPVMIATSGDRLLDADAESALRSLVEHCDAVTPNIPELAILAEEEPAETWDDVLDQAARVSSRFGVLVVAKGGHLTGPEAPDAVVDARGDIPQRTIFPGGRLHTTNTHGTGCSFSAAIATRVAAGEAWPDAVRAAKMWLREAISAGAALEVGRGHGPINHFAALWHSARCAE